MLLTTRCTRRRARAPNTPQFFSYIHSSSAASAAGGTETITGHILPYSQNPFFPTFSPPASTRGIAELQADVVLSFKEWFMTRKDPLFDYIFEILRTQDDASADSSLSRLNLRLTEHLVLQILSYPGSNSDVLSCIRFFDWAGRQTGFHHTRATFNAIFRILSKAKRRPLILDFLEKYTKQKYYHRVRFYNTLVIGYSVAGKPVLALHLFGKMRFQGMDLDTFAYHVLLNSLVDDGFLDAVEMVSKQIRSRGLENSITHSILVKSLCKQGKLDRAEEYLKGLVGGGGVGLSGVVVGTLVDALCKGKQYVRAVLLVDEFRKSGVVSMDQAYGVWIAALLRAGKLDGALEFMNRKKLKEGYVPDVFRYNMLICRLLRENRLEEVCDLLTEMKERNILPDEVTMNVSLCFFCKAGMVDVALELYDARAELGLSLNSMAYNYLINTLLGDVNVDEAYRLLRSAIEQDYFPGRKTFNIIADALCREGKLETMKDLVLLALDKNFMPSDLTYNKFISALCKARRVEDAYAIQGGLTRLNKVVTRNAYFNLISGFYRLNKGEIAARLIIEMQEKGYAPTRQLYRAVLCHLCQMDNPEQQFFTLLQMQLSRNMPSCTVYNFFIDGAGHAGKPELAREVYEMMGRSGLSPNFRSDLLLLQSYLKGDKIADALNFFQELANQKEIKPKIWHCMIVGLCRAHKLDYALEFFWKMRATQHVPSMDCYEELVKLLCSRKNYSAAFDIIDDLIQVGRPISSFIGNVILLHALRGQKLYDAWCSRNVQSGTFSFMALDELIETFSASSKVNQDFEKMEKLIHQCFPPDIYTYNLLLRRLTFTGMDHACEYLHSIREKGYEPNKWSYDTLVHGFLRLGQSSEAKRWMEEMYNKGFDLNEYTKRLL